MWKDNAESLEAYTGMSAFIEGYPLRDVQVVW